MELEKLTIAKLKKSAPNNLGLTSEEFVCQYNPTEFQIDKVNNWKFKSRLGRNVPKPTFTGGESQDITIKLLLDSTDTGKPVTDLYYTLFTFTLVDKNNKNPRTGKGEPPWVVVKWGTKIDIVAVITRFSEHFLMFLPNGIPIRAEVTFTLKQIIDRTERKPQNPTSFSEARTTRRFQKGERLDTIAYEVFGETSAWRQIAEANNILNPLKIQPGRILKIPTLP